MTKFRPIAVIRETWNIYTPVERRNIAMYIAGIMMYKFGLEAFNGSVIALATNRYDALEKRTDVSITFQRVGILTGLNQAFQCVGSILIAPLIKRYPTKNVLACAILIFGVMSSILLILDAATGGRFAPKGHNADDFSYYGSYDTDSMIPICEWTSNVSAIHASSNCSHCVTFSEVNVRALTEHSLRMRCRLRYGRAHPQSHPPRPCRRQCPKAATYGRACSHLLRSFWDGRSVLHSSRADPAFREQLFFHHNPDILRRSVGSLVLYSGGGAASRKQPDIRRPTHLR